MIIDILRGSRNEKILSLGLESLSTWGIMKDAKAQRIRTVLDCLIENGILLLEEGDYPVVKPGKAMEFLKEEQKLILKLPVEKKPRLPGKKQDDPKLPGFGKSGRASETGEADEALLEKLKRLRKQIASAESVPAYIVFSDVSLFDMCRKKPVSIVQFSKIIGVGSVKLEKYGEIFTSLIRDHLSMAPKN